MGNYVDKPEGSFLKWQSIVPLPMFIFTKKHLSQKPTLKSYLKKTFTLRKCENFRDPVKIAFQMRNLTHRRTQPGDFFKNQGTFFSFRKGAGKTPPPRLAPMNYDWSKLRDNSNYNYN